MRYLMASAVALMLCLPTDIVLAQNINTKTFPDYVKSREEKPGPPAATDYILILRGDKLYKMKSAALTGHLLWDDGQILLWDDGTQLSGL
jgi:hypothetical protein